MALLPHGLQDSGVLPTSCDMRLMLLLQTVFLTVFLYNITQHAGPSLSHRSNTAHITDSCYERYMKATTVSAVCNAGAFNHLYAANYGMKIWALLWNGHQPCSTEPLVIISWEPINISNDIKVFNNNLITVVVLVA